LPQDSSLQHANKIIVIDDAKIAEQGTHEELLKIKGICQGEKIDFDESALLLIAQNSEGSLRDAESFDRPMHKFFGKKRNNSQSTLKIY